VVSRTTAATVGVPMGTGRCRDVPHASQTNGATGNATANGTLIDLWTCNGGNNQKWTRS
jgi:hypothetical protein